MRTTKLTFNRCRIRGVPPLCHPPSKTLSMNHQACDPALENESLGFLVRSAYRAFTRSLNGKLAAHDIPTSNWSALRVLWRQDGCSQVELAERLHVEKPSLTPVLVSLKRKGLVTLSRNAEDKRKTIILLTPKGRNLKNTIFPLADAVNREATAGLGRDEVIQIKYLLSTVIENLKSTEGS
jgi:DNA-binding MarR family transcriptional regulator